MSVIDISGDDTSTMNNESGNAPISGETETKDEKDNSRFDTDNMHKSKERSGTSKAKPPPFSFPNPIPKAQPAEIPLLPSYKWPNSVFSVEEYNYLLDERLRLRNNGENKVNVAKKPFEMKPFPHPRLRYMPPPFSATFDCPLDSGSWAKPLLKAKNPLVPDADSDDNGTISVPNLGELKIPPFFDALDVRNRMVADIRLDYSELGVQTQSTKRRRVGMGDNEIATADIQFQINRDGANTSTNMNAASQLHALIRSELPGAHARFIVANVAQRQFLHQVALECQKIVQQKWVDVSNLESQSRARVQSIIGSGNSGLSLPLTLRSRRLCREMQSYWRVRGKEDQQALRQADKEAKEQLKMELERREAKTQQAKLNFLLTQSEIFVHFMSNKMGDMSKGKKEDEKDEGEGEGEGKGKGSSSESESKRKNTYGEPQDILRDSKVVPGAVAPGKEDVEKLHQVLETGDVSTEAQEPEIIVDKDGDHIESEESIRTRAVHTAAAAIQEVEANARGFDAEVKERHEAAAQVEVERIEELNGDGDGDQLNDIAQRIDETDLLNPSTMPEQAKFIGQPTILNAVLKSYQLKGLNWLANLYELGINGILADEMGLGKTITCISLLSYLAESKNVWGPFLILSPASTLHHWREELNRFCPSLKVLPYWGDKDDREVLRMYWKDELLLTKNASFHVCVTSYQLVVRDFKFFQQCPWQYLVLDEAQAIKSYKSQRWMFIKGLKVRARLLMTGTPIQNSMAELWALLNFIMPQLFDDHREFNEWFSKGIEQHAVDDAELNSHQLNRLHVILKPFMLRRVKQDVENEMPKKTEIDIPTHLTPHQRHMYDTIRANISLSDINSNWSDEKQKSLMNLIMQLRKVCNHPLLFERRYIKSAFVFNEMSAAYSGSWEPEKRRSAGSSESDQRENVVPLSRNAITFRVPQLVAEDPPHNSGAYDWYPGSVTIAGSSMAAHRKWLHDEFSIYNPLYSTAVSFLSLCGLSVNEAHFLACAPDILKAAICRGNGLRESLLSHGLNRSRGSVMVKLKSDALVNELSELSDVVSGYGPRLKWSGIARKLFSLGSYVDSVIASPIHISVNGKKWHLYRQQAIELQEWGRRIVFGRSFGYARPVAPPYPLSSMPGSFRRRIPELDPYRGRRYTFSSVEDAMRGSDDDIAPGVLGDDRFVALYGDSQNPSLSISPASSIISDSGKMAKLDELLCDLKEGGHRVLIYSQMVKVLDILESFMRYRYHKYLRLDGSTSIPDRRVIVDEFKNNRDIFVFLLSTRAAGLGLNLVAADTVIFFESDWNPTVDNQAMDRVHRLGQTKPVTIYRLVAKNSIEERILVRAKEKANIQDIIISGGKFKPDDFKQHEVVSLLVQDEEVNDIVKEKRAERKKDESGKRKRKRKKKKDKVEHSEPNHRK